MAELLAETRHMSESRFEHLQPMEVASYVDGAATGEARARIESHLAQCADCRDEVVEAGRISATMSYSRFKRARLWIPAAAVAAALLLMVRPNALREPGIEHRESPVLTTVAPRALAPVGQVDSAARLLWSSVPHTDRYHVRLFDADGSVIWERETSDTTAVVPASVSLVLGRTYFWKVEAQTGFGRTAATELTEFSVRHVRRP